MSRLRPPILLCAFALGSAFSDICHSVARVGDVCPWTWEMLQTGASFPESLLLDTHQHTAHRGEAAARLGAGHLPREFELHGEPLRGFKE